MNAPVKTLRKLPIGIQSFEFLRSEHKNPLVLFAGHNIGEDYLFELQTLLKNKSFGIVVISKSESDGGF